MIDYNNTNININTILIVLGLIIQLYNIKQKRDARGLEKRIKNSIENSLGNIENLFARRLINEDSKEIEYDVTSLHDDVTYLHKELAKINKELQHFIDSTEKRYKKELYDKKYGTNDVYFQRHQ